MYRIEYLNKDVKFAVPWDIYKEGFEKNPVLKGAMKNYYQPRHKPATTQGEKNEVTAHRDQVISGFKDLVDECRSCYKSFRFFETTLTVYADNSSAETRECSICLEDDLPLSNLVVTPCAHVFCKDCARDQAAQFHKCGICNQKLEVADLHNLEMVVKDKTEAEKKREELKNPKQNAASGMNENDKASDADMKKALADATKALKDDEEGVSSVF